PPRPEEVSATDRWFPPPLGEGRASNRWFPPPRGEGRVGAVRPEEETVNVYRAVSELKPARIWDGVLARVVHGDRVTVGFVEIDPDVLVPEHRHDHEQVGFVLRGSVTMEIAGQSRELRVGETYII